MKHACQVEGHVSMLTVIIQMQVYHVPYSLCIDSDKEAVVVAIRGTLSLEV